MSKKEFLELQRLKSTASEQPAPQIIPQKPPEGNQRVPHQDLNTWSNPIPQQVTAYADSRNPQILPNQRRPLHTNQNVTHPSSFENNGLKLRSDQLTAVYRVDNQAIPANGPAPTLPSNIPDKQITQRHTPGGQPPQVGSRVEERTPKEPKAPKKQKPLPADAPEDIGQDVQQAPHAARPRPTQRVEENSSFGMQGVPEDSKLANKKAKTKNTEQLHPPALVDQPGIAPQSQKPLKQTHTASNPHQTMQKKNVLANSRIPVQANGSYEEVQFEHQSFGLPYHDPGDSNVGQSYRIGDSSDLPRATIGGSELTGQKLASLGNRPISSLVQEEPSRVPVPGPSSNPAVPKKDSKKHTPQPHPQLPKKPQPHLGEALPSEPQNREAEIAQKKLPKKAKPSPSEEAPPQSTQGRNPARPPAGEKVPDPGQGLTLQEAPRNDRADDAQLSKIRHLQDQVKLLEDSCVQLESFSRSIGIGIEFYLEYDWVRFIEKVRSYLLEVQKVDGPPDSGSNPQNKLSDKRLSILENSISKKLAHVELIIQSEAKGQASLSKESVSRDGNAQSMRTVHQKVGQSTGPQDPARQDPSSKQPDPASQPSTEQRPAQPPQNLSQSVEQTAAKSAGRPSQPRPPVAEPDAYQDHYAFLSASSRTTARVHQEFIKQNLTHSSYGSIIYSPFAFHFSPVPQYSVAANLAPQTYHQADFQYQPVQGYSSFLPNPLAAEEFSAPGLPGVVQGLDSNREHYSGPNTGHHPSDFDQAPLTEGLQNAHIGQAQEAGLSGEPQEGCPVDFPAPVDLPAQPDELEIQKSASVPGDAGSEVLPPSIQVDSREELLASGSVFRQADNRLESAGFISNIALVELASNLHQGDDLGYSMNLFGRFPAKKEEPLSTSSRDVRPNLSNGFSLFAAGPNRKDSEEQKKVSVEHEYESSSGSRSRRELLFNSDDESSQGQDKRSSGEAASADHQRNLQSVRSGSSDSEHLGPESKGEIRPAGGLAALVDALADGPQAEETHPQERDAPRSTSERSAQEKVPETHHTEAPANGPNPATAQEPNFEAAPAHAESSSEHSGTPRSEGNRTSPEPGSTREQLPEARAPQTQLGGGEVGASELDPHLPAQGTTSPALPEAAGASLESIGGAEPLDHQTQLVSAGIPALADPTAQPAPDRCLDSPPRLQAQPSHDGSIHPDSKESHPSADLKLEQQVDISRPELDAELDLALQTNRNEKGGKPESQESPPFAMNESSVTSDPGENGMASRREPSAPLVENQGPEEEQTEREEINLESLRTSSNKLPEPESEGQNHKELKEEPEAESQKLCTEIVESEANERDAPKSEERDGASIPVAQPAASAFFEMKSEAESSNHSHKESAQGRNGQSSLKVSEGMKSKQSEVSVHEQTTPIISTPKTALQSKPRYSSQPVSGKGLEYHKSKLEEVCHRALQESMVSVRKVLEMYASRRGDKKTDADYFTREENPENLSLFDICTNPNYAVVVKKKINKLTESERIDFFYQIKPFLMELAKDSIGILVIYTLISMSSHTSSRY